jgi:hypothetical protein
MSSLSCLLFLLPSLGLSIQQEPIQLSSYNILNNVATVSGISSGGYMAVQLHVAFSSSFNGSGVFAAGPYYCAQASILIAEDACAFSFMKIDLDTLVSYTKDQAALGTIDSVENLLNDRTYLFSGTKDSVVDPKVVSALKDYYSYFLSPSNILTKFDLVAQHDYPTLSYGNPCTTLAAPYLGDCDYDGAGVTLQTLYGFESFGSSKSENLFQFDQTPFYSGKVSLDTTGYIYIPTACGSGTGCHLHVAIHGCNQNQQSVGSVFAEHAGYNEWAEKNNVIVVYPQTIKDATLGNPEGCWDWWGYLGKDDYALKSGPQMAFIKKIIDTLRG